MKLTKILVALSFLFAVSTANAGELTVTGNMQATYQSETEATTGNPLGMDRELKFAGSTELDNGVTVSVMQDTGDSLTFGNSLITFGGVGGLVDISIGSDGGVVDAIDDVTPNAFEEANATSGTYNDIGDDASKTGITLSADLPILGTFKTKYIPKTDGNKNADKEASANTNAGVGSMASYSLVTDLGSLPVAGDALSGAKLTLGYLDHDHTTTAITNDALDATAALTYVNGPFSLGIQKKYHNEGTSATRAANAVFYKDTVIGLAYAVNDALSVSYNRYESYKHDKTGAPIQETDAISIGYTMGGMTIGFQEAGTDNAGYVKDTTDDTRTVSVVVAF